MFKNSQNALAGHIAARVFETPALYSGNLVRNKETWDPHQTR